jgi:hypothetical protein
MLLIDPAKALLAIDIKCAPTQTAGQDVLKEQIRLLTPKVAALLDMPGLEYATYRDTFKAPRGMYEPAYPFRLSYGFIDGDVTMNVTDPVDALVNNEYGTVQYTSYNWDGAYITAEYAAGFKVDEDSDTNPDYRLALDVPDWIQGAVVDALVVARRIVQQTPSLPEKWRGGLVALHQAVQDDLRHRIYGRFLRPRARVLWAIKSEKVS